MEEVRLDEKNHSAANSSNGLQANSVLTLIPEEMCRQLLYFQLFFIFKNTFIMVVKQSHVLRLIMKNYQ